MSSWVSMVITFSWIARAVAMISSSLIAPEHAINTKDAATAPATVMVRMFPSLDWVSGWASRYPSPCSSLWKRGSSRKGSQVGSALSQGSDSGASTASSDSSWSMAAACSPTLT